jgi:two-component system NtrC family response regulator
LRKDNAFLAINCAAIPETLLESELFGYEKGAFTGATKQTQGKLELANGGTLFLDEIGDLPMSLQAKLLRFLQERVIERVGGRKVIPLDLRIICATHQDLKGMIEKGAFREDLFYRVSEITINIPPLRERTGDAVLLAKAFLARFSKESKTNIKGFTQEALDAIDTYSWPGNVRELENKVKRAIIMADGVMVTPEELQLDVVKTGVTLNLKEAREKIEAEIIMRALNRVNGNISKASELVGVSRPTLYDLMDKYNIKQ